MRGDAGAGQVGESNHPGKTLVTVQHRQAADLVLGHDLGGAFTVIVFEAVVDAFGHDLAHRAVAGGLVVRHAAHGDVAIRDHADEAVVLADRQRADIIVAHPLCGIPDCGVGVDEVHGPGHDFSNVHV